MGKWTAEFKNDECEHAACEFTMAAVDVDSTVYVGLGTTVYALSYDSGRQIWSSTHKGLVDAGHNSYHYPPVISPFGQNPQREGPTVFVAFEEALYAYRDRYWETGADVQISV